MKKYKGILNADLEDIILNKQNPIDWDAPIDFDAIRSKQENSNKDETEIKYLPNGNTLEYLGGPCGWIERDKFGNMI